MPMPLRWVVELVAELMAETIADLIGNQVEALFRKPRALPSGGGRRTDRPPLRKVLRAYAPDQVDHQAEILEKPDPRHVQAAMWRGREGKVKLKAVLCLNGKVKGIQPISGLRGGLTEAAIEAAKRIRFSPATKRGLRVSQWVELEYDFGPERKGGSSTV